MSLLLDALQRASKDKEKAGLAAANTLPPFDLEIELEMPSPASSTDPKQDLTFALEAAQPETPLPTAQQPSTITPSARATQEGATGTTGAANTAGPLELVGRESPVSSFAARPATVPPNAQAAANAIRNGYAQPPNRKATGRRMWIIASVAICTALGLGSFQFGLFGDTARLLELAGLSSWSSAPTPAPIPAQMQATKEPALPPPPLAAASTPQQTTEPQSGVLGSAPATIAANTAAVAVPRAPMPPPGQGQAPSEQREAQAPIFSTNMTGQSPLEKGYAALVVGRLDDAAQAYQAALANNPLEPDALLGLAYIAHSKGRREEALALYTKVLRVDPSNSIAHAGLIALDTGVNGAIKGDRAKALVSNQPNSAAAQALAGDTLGKEGLIAEAALAFGRAHALEPDNPWHSYNLAVALDKMGNYAQAGQQYENALRNAGSATSPLGTQRIQALRTRMAQLRELRDQESDNR